MRFQHLITIVLMLALAGLSVWLTSRYTWEADWTHANRNSLTQASKRVVDSMPGEITITAFVYPGPGRQAIRDAVDRYRRYDDRLSLEFIDPATNPQKMRELGIRQDGTLRIGYKDRYETVAKPSEQTITSALQRLSVSGEQWAVFLTGHGERDPRDTEPGGYDDLRKALDRQGLRVRSLNLAESPQIPDNTAVLVLASPQRELLSGEAEMVREYVADGGNLLWLNDPSGGNVPASLADTLGITWQQGTAIYPDYRELGTGDPAIAVALEYPQHAVTRNLDGVTLFPYAGGVQPAGDGRWESKPLMQTPQRTWLETGSLEKERIAFEEDSGDTVGPITLGLALTRPYPGDHTEEAPDKQRVAVVADSDFLTNANIGAVSNRGLGLGLLQWLGYRDQQIAVEVPAAPDASLQLAPWQGRTIWLAFVVVLPLLLVAAGVGRWWLRRRR